MKSSRTCKELFTNGKFDPKILKNKIIIERICSKYSGYVKFNGIHRSAFSSALQKVLKLVPLTSTGPEVYVATMPNILSGYYDYLDETLNHMKSLKLKDHRGGECRRFL